MMGVARAAVAVALAAVGATASESDGRMKQVLYATKAAERGGLAGSAVSCVFLSFVDDGWMMQ